MPFLIGGVLHYFLWLTQGTESAVFKLMLNHFSLLRCSQQVNLVLIFTLMRGITVAASLNCRASRYPLA